MSNEYLVVTRQGQWWVLFDGHRLGPHETTLAAEVAAIALAKLDEKSGKQARVTTELDELHVVYPTR